MKRIIKRQVLTHSTCGTAKIRDLDFTNWHQDDTMVMLNRGGDCYLHVKKTGDDTWHRVHPKVLTGKKVTRVAAYFGILHWLYDDINV